METQTATPRNDAHDADMLKMYAPFFEATRAATDYAKGNYLCVFCETRVENNTPGGRSFSGTEPRWAHVDCLRTVKGASLSTDKKAKAKAQEAAQTRWKAARQATRAAQQDTTTPTVDAKALRAQIVQEYSDLMTEAGNRILELMQENAELQAKYDALLAASSKAAQRRAALVSR